MKLRSNLSILAGLLLAVAGVKGQSASDACNFAAGQQFPVQTSCVPTAFNLVDAWVTNLSPAMCGGAAVQDDGFGWFTAIGTSTTVTYTAANAGHNPTIHIYAGAACGSLGTPTCYNASSTNVESATFATTIGQSYLVRVQRNGSNNAMSGTICIHSPLANDEPCTATALSVGASCTPVTYSNSGATSTSGPPTPGCGSFGAGSRDVWFTFTAPASGFAAFRTTAGTLANTAMALYRAASCSAPMTLIECDDNNGAGAASFLAFSDLIPGTTHYLRIWGVGGTSGSFALCAYAPPTGTSCFYALNMVDAIGDGWGGSTVGISINGGPYTNHTLANGEEDVVYIPITIGQLVMVQYTAAGGAQNEISYTLQLGAGALYSAGPTPPTGPVFTGMADCNPPPAPSSDCRGGASICDAQTFNASPSNTGLVADLNVQNRGCLASSERQGLWYNFTPFTGGTVAFTIAPTNSADDYDFAVWGPFTTVDCTNKGAPLRCSYSGLTGNTGLQVGAGDNSEGGAGNKWVNALTVNAGEVYILYISNYSLSGLSFDLTWQLTNGSSLDCFVLPVELLAFEATPHHTSVDLDWSTATELNNDRFVVERGTSTTDFRPIGEVDGAGNSITRIDYAFTDHAPLAGTSYYRLRQVDLDGAVMISHARSVTFTPQGPDVQVRPNPVEDLLVAHIDAKEAGEALLRVLDARGAVVLQQQVTLVPGPQVIPVPVHGLSAGIHVLSLSSPAGATSAPVRFVVK